MKLTKKLTTAIKAVSVLRGSTTTMSNVQLAEATGSTTTVVAQIMGNLRKNGIVTVKRGPGGGYTLSESGPVSVMRISQAVGRNFNVSSEENSPTGSLQKQIVQAFLDTWV